MSRGTQECRRGSPRAVAYGAFTLCCPPFQGGSANAWIDHFPTGSQSGPAAPYNPAQATPASYRTYAVWAVPVSLATTQGIS